MKYLQIFAIGCASLVMRNVESMAAEESPKQPTITLQVEDRSDAMLQLSDSVTRAILEATNSSRVVGIEDVVMRTLPKANLLVITVSLVPKSEKAKEGVVHRGLIVLNGWHRPIVVYDLDERVLPLVEFIQAWQSDSNYKLPVGRGLTKLYEGK